MNNKCTYSFYTQPQKHTSNAKIIFPEWGAPLESYIAWV